MGLVRCWVPELKGDAETALPHTPGDTTVSGHKSDLLVLGEHWGFCTKLDLVVLFEYSDSAL